jgi:hypothetical protein
LPVHLFCSCCCGGHVMIGPPSGAGTCGTAAAIYVPTSPSIRTEILIASFMGLLLSRQTCPKNRALLAWRGIIRHESSPSARIPDSANTSIRAGHFFGRPRSPHKSCKYGEIRSSSKVFPLCKPGQDCGGIEAGMIAGENLRNPESRCRIRPELQEA